jgi:hypothetical protein
MWKTYGFLVRKSSTNGWVTIEKLGLISNNIDFNGNLMVRHDDHLLVF